MTSLLGILLFVLVITPTLELQPPVKYQAAFAPSTGMPDTLHGIFCDDSGVLCRPVFTYGNNSALANVYFAFPNLRVKPETLKRYHMEQLGMHVLEFQVALFEDCYLEWVKQQIGNPNASVMPYILQFSRIKWLADPPVTRVVLGNSDKMPPQQSATSIYFHIFSDAEEVLAKFQNDYFTNATETGIFDIFGVEFQKDATVARYKMEKNVATTSNTSIVMSLYLAADNDSVCFKPETAVTTTPTVTEKPEPGATTAAPWEGPCFNELPCCGVFAKDQSKCTSAPVFMRKNCAAACGICKPNYNTTDCEDYFDDCSAWADKKECVNNLDWMAENCRKSCLLCSIPRDKFCGNPPPTEMPGETSGTTKPMVTTTTSSVVDPGPPSEECFNEEPCCAFKARQPGGCQSNFMKENCRSACRLCTPMVKPVDGQCEDYRNNCGQWAQNGECQKNEEWMAENCRQSCGLCQTPRGCDGGGSGSTHRPVSTRPTTRRPSQCGSRVEGACNSCVGGVQRYSGRHSNYYRRLCITKKGIRVVTAGVASDYSLHRAAFLLDKVMENVDARVAQSMNRYRFQHVVMGAYPRELTMHIPEHRHLGAYWNERARGLGGTIHIPTGSCAEENLMCHSNDRYRGEDITIHEFAHSLHLLGLKPTYPTFNGELEGLYRSIRASRSNPWAGGYAMTNAIEYWAEAVQAYLGANMPGREPATREQLRRRDPRIYALVRRYLGDINWSRTC